MRAAAPAAGCPVTTSSSQGRQAASNDSRPLCLITCPLLLTDFVCVQLNLFTLVELVIGRPKQTPVRSAGRPSQRKQERCQPEVGYHSAVIRQFTLSAHTGSPQLPQQTAQELQEPRPGRLHFPVA